MLLDNTVKWIGGLNRSYCTCNPNRVDYCFIMECCLISKYNVLSQTYHLIRLYTCSIINSQIKLEEQEEFFISADNVMYYISLVYCILVHLYVFICFKRSFLLISLHSFKQELKNAQECLESERFDTKTLLMQTSFLCFPCHFSYLNCYTSMHCWMLVSVLNRWFLFNLLGVMFCAIFSLFGCIFFLLRYFPQRC